MLVSNEIQDYQLKFQDLKDELKSLQGLLVLQNQRLSEEELNLKWFKVRKDVLTQKKTEMLARKENLLQQKVTPLSPLFRLRLINKSNLILCGLHFVDYSLSYRTTIK